MTLAAASWVPCATFWTLRAISCVAVLCCATRVRYRGGRDIRNLADGAADFSLIAATDSCVAPCMAGDVVGDFVGPPSRVWLASDLTSDADHGKAAAGIRRARAASMVAFNAKRLVCIGDRRDQLDDVADLLRRGATVCRCGRRSVSA